MRYKLFVLFCMIFLWAGITFMGRPAAAVQEPVVVDEDPLALSSLQVIPPTKRRKLVAWLKAGTYKKLFTAEPSVDRSSGPHGGNVRTFYNPILTEDLKAGKNVWRSGAAMVKELYLSGKDEVKGYAVMVKVSDSSGANGEGWVFLETFDINSPGSGFYGRGIGICSNCHSGGVDYLLDSFRP